MKAISWVIQSAPFRILGFMVTLAHFRVELDLLPDLLELTPVKFDLLGFQPPKVSNPDQ